jgi:hypothetical protein
MMLELEDIAEVVATAVREATAPLAKRISALESEVAQVKAKGLTYRGVWQRASDYERGAIVTHGGTAWAATKAVTEGEEPGKDGKWQMMLKPAR